MHGLYFTSSDEESAAQLEQFMAYEGDPTDQQEASCQSSNQAKDYQHGPETPKHCGEKKKIKAFKFRAVTRHCLRLHFGL